MGLMDVENEVNVVNGKIGEELIKKKKKKNKWVK